MFCPPLVITIEVPFAEGREVPSGNDSLLQIRSGEPGPENDKDRPLGDRRISFGWREIARSVHCRIYNRLGETGTSPEHSQRCS